MKSKEEILEALYSIMDNKTDVDWSQYEIPPPVFEAMQGEFVDFDEKRSFLRCKFPVLPEQINPYGKMQGGIVSAAIDNVIGPLSILIAPPNVTRKAEIKYLNAIDSEVDFVYVSATFIVQKKQFLYFEANVENESQTIIYATSKFTNWVL